MPLVPLKEIIYKDLDLTFAKHPVTNQPAVLKNANAISRSIKNLVLTNRFERLFQPNTYSDVVATLFENFDPITVQILKNAIIDVIKNNEKRAQLMDVIINEDFDNNGLEVTVMYMPLNAREIVEVRIFLERTR